jgi:hypothetical protein
LVFIVSVIITFIKSFNLLPALWRRTWFTALSTVLALKYSKIQRIYVRRRDIICSQLHLNLWVEPF